LDGDIKVPDCFTTMKTKLREYSSAGAQGSRHFRIAITERPVKKKRE